MRPQLSSAQLFTAQQRRAVPCPAVRCCVVLRCTFVLTYSSTRYDVKYQVPVSVMCVRTCCVLVFLLSWFSSLLSLGPHVACFPPLSYTRTADQNVTSPTRTQHSAHHRATSSAQAAALGIINSLATPIHGPLIFFSPLYICSICTSPCTRAEPLYIERKRGLDIHVVLEVSCAAPFAAQLALHEAMRSSNASYRREPSPFFIAARSACCLCRRCAHPYHGGTSEVPGTPYPLQHTAQHPSVSLVATRPLPVFPGLGDLARQGHLIYRFKYDPLPRAHHSAGAQGAAHICVRRRWR